MLITQICRRKLILEIIRRAGGWGGVLQKDVFWIWYGCGTHTFSVAAVTWTRLGLSICERTWFEGRLRRTHRSPWETAGSQQLLGEEMPPRSPAVSPLKTSSRFGKELPTCAPGILIKLTGSHTHTKASGKQKRGARGRRMVSVEWQMREGNGRERND